MRTAERLRERLMRASSCELLGRERELAQLEAQLEERGAVLAFVYGIGGIGKSSLLAAAAARFAARGARVCWLDGRHIEPTERGFLGALAQELGQAAFVDVEAAAAALDAEPGPLVLLVDELDHLRLLDAWLRDTLLPSLPGRVRWICAGRFAPAQAWLSSPGWSQAVLPLRLGSLAAPAARAWLARRGIPEEQHPRLVSLARGTPLALALICAHAHDSDSLEGINESALLASLAERSADNLPLALRQALEAASLVRRATRPMLEAMLGMRLEEQTFNELGELSFVELTADGLTLHETVRQALASRLRALDPERHLRLRRAAWRTLESQLGSSVPTGPNAWRLTADMLFVVEHPEIREAFFPTRESGNVVEAARAEDHTELAACVERDEPAGWSAVFEAWWRLARSAFRIVRAPSGRALGFAIVAPAHELPPELAAFDPLLRAWQADLASGPGRERGALFMRRLTADQPGDAANEARAAIWLDVKRSYVERPGQWALYAATHGPPVLLPLLRRLGFEQVPLDVDGEGTLRLEFGAAGLWSWLRALVNETELGSAERAATPRPPWRLDPARRELLIDGQAQPLSALEYRTLLFLLERSGSVVTRDELLGSVWERAYTSSNVVDAVMRLLRKKLGPYATSLETVRGHGYRIAISNGASG